MAFDPTFDPGQLNEVSNSNIFSNKFVEDRYEMGSIVKSLAMAAGGARGGHSGLRRRSRSVGGGSS